MTTQISLVQGIAWKSAAAHHSQSAQRGCWHQIFNISFSSFFPFEEKKKNNQTQQIPPQLISSQFYFIQQNGGADGLKNW